MFCCWSSCRRGPAQVVHAYHVTSRPAGIALGRFRLIGESSAGTAPSSSGGLHDDADKAYRRAATVPRSSQHPCCCFRQPPRMAHRVLYTCLPPPVAACARIPLVLVLTVMQHVHDLHVDRNEPNPQKELFDQDLDPPRIGRISIVTYAADAVPHPGFAKPKLLAVALQGRTHHPGTAGGGLGWLAGCNGGQGASTVHGSKQHVARAQAWGSHRILA